MNKGRERIRETNTESYRAARQKENVIDWEPGQQQALIEKAIAEGKVTKCKPGALTVRAFSPYAGGIRETTIDRFLPERRANMRDNAGRGY